MVWFGLHETSREMHFLRSLFHKNDHWPKAIIHARRHAHADQQHLMALRLSGFSIDAALLGITIWHNGWAMLGILTNIYV